MPLYEYACRECGYEFEARQKFSDPHLTDCPQCGAASLERLVSQSSFALKGGGWYADGYGAAPAKKEDAKAPKKEGGSDNKDAPNPKKDRAESKKDKGTKSDASGDSSKKAANG